MLNPCNRRNVLQVLGLQTLAGSVLLGSGAESPEIATGLTPLERARLDSQAFGDLRYFFEGHTEQLKILTVGSLVLKPGQSPHPPHTHPEEEVLVITEGHGEISLEGKVSQVGPGTTVYVGSNRLHGIVNTSSSPLTFYYVKWLGK